MVCFGLTGPDSHLFDLVFTIIPYMFLQYKGWEQKPFVKPFRKPFYCLFSKSEKALNLSLNEKKKKKKKESGIFNIKNKILASID